MFQLEELLSNHQTRDLLMTASASKHSRQKDRRVECMEVGGGGNGSGHHEERILIKHQLLRQKERHKMLE